MPWNLSCSFNNENKLQFVLLQIINHFRAKKRTFLENRPRVRAQKHLGTVRQLLLPRVEFFLSVRNHTIAQSQQLARLHVSNPTICTSQALTWQEWQCLHRGSSARAVNLIGSYYHQVIHSLLVFIKSAAAAMFSCWLIKQVFSPLLPPS